MRRDTIAMLFWVLRRHQGHRVSNRLLEAVLWGDFAPSPKNPTSTLRQYMTDVQERYGDGWTIVDCDGRAFEVFPRFGAGLAFKSAADARPTGKYRRRSQGPGVGK
jgi:hypothetical protein